MKYERVLESRKRPPKMRMISRRDSRGFDWDNDWVFGVNDLDVDSSDEDDEDEDDVLV